MNSKFFQIIVKNWFSEHSEPFGTIFRARIAMDLSRSNNISKEFFFHLGYLHPKIFFAWIIIKVKYVLVLMCEWRDSSLGASIYQMRVYKYTININRIIRLDHEGVGKGILLWKGRISYAMLVKAQVTTIVDEGRATNLSLPVILINE